MSRLILLPGLAGDAVMWQAQVGALAAWNPAVTDVHMRHNSVSGMAAALLTRQNRAVIERPDARAHLPGLRCPTLVMCGDTDQLTPPENSHEIAGLVPDAELVVVPHCGHMLTMEQPQHINVALHAWLARHAPPG